MRLLFWGKDKIPEELSLEDAFTVSGENFGNLLFGNAMRRILAKHEIIEYDTLPIEQADERCDRIILPVANILWEGFDLGYLYNDLIKTKLPVTIVGVGAQTHNRSKVPKVHPNTVRLMKLVSERTKKIGVRGYYTAEVLGSLGIHNVEVLGCPSLYTSCKPSIEIRKKPSSEIQKVAYHASRNLVQHSFSAEKMLQVERKVFQWVQSKDAMFFAQDELAELHLEENEAFRQDHLSRYYSGDHDRVVDFFVKRRNYFRSYPAWAAAVETVDFSIGSRLHGNIMALINGVPSLLVVHDSRTLEIASIFNMPYFHILDYDSDSDFEIDRLIDSTDYSGFLKSYALFYARFKAFLWDQQLDNCLE